MRVLFLSNQLLREIRKRRVGSLCAFMLALLLFSAHFTGVAAHPLGNFTINHYARLEIAPTQLQLYIVYDFAEIPTFQAKQTLDVNGDGNLTEEKHAQYLNALLKETTSNLTLTIGGRRADLSLVPNSAQLEFLPGQGGLEIMQVRVRYTVALDLSGAPVAIQYRDDNYRERLGWREIVAKSTGGATITQSNVRATETSDELRKYPDNLLANPLNDREAALTVTRNTTSTIGTSNESHSNSNSILIIASVLIVIAVVSLLAAFFVARAKPPIAR